MKKSITLLLAALMLMTMQACSADAETETAVDERNAVPTGQARSGAIDHTQTYEYTTEDLWMLDFLSAHASDKNQQEEDNTTGIRPVVM